MPRAAPTGIDIDGDKMVLACGNILFTSVLQDGVNYFGGSWTKIGRLPGPWIASCWMGGLCYILCGGPDKLCSLVAFDGVQLLPVCEFPYNFYGESLAAYAGRIYVGGSGLDINGNYGYAELHEVTGSTSASSRPSPPSRIPVATSRLPPSARWPFTRACCSSATLARG